MSSRAELKALLDEMNESELVIMAQALDSNVHRSLGREFLIGMILDYQLAGDPCQAQLPDRSIDKRRLQIMDYVLAHWEGVKPIIQCPAKSRDPRACFRCTDVQAMECYTINQVQLEPQEEEEEQ